MRSHWLIGLLCLLALPACGGHGVDLDTATPTVVANPDPNVLGTLREDFLQIEVDDQRIYWRAYDPQTLGVLRACDKLSCPTTVTTFDTSVISPFHVQNGQIYWLEGMSGNLMAATRDGADQRTIGLANSFLATFSADTAFVVQPQPGAMPDADGVLPYEIDAVSLTDGSSRTLAPLEPEESVLGLVAKGDYLYFFRFFALSDGSERTTDLDRVRIDGQGARETLLSKLRAQLPFNDTEPSSGIGTSIDLVADDQYLYWPEDALRGQIVRYPLSGGPSAPEALSPPIRSPQRLVLDGKTLFYTYELDAYSYGVAKCATDLCTPSTALATGLESLRLLAVDDKFIYSVTSNKPFDDLSYANEGNTVQVVGQLRKAPK